MWSLVFDVHPDGRQIAFAAGENSSEVWVLENFLISSVSERDPPDNRLEAECIRVRDPFVTRL